MLVGAAREWINPDLGHCICGYTHDDANTGVHDDLAVTALYLSDGQHEAFLLNFDLVGMTAGTIAAIQKSVGRACRVRPQNVFATCTHIHSGPEMVDAHIVEGWPTRNARKDYLARVVQRAQQAAVAAKASAEECRLHYNFTCVEENMNRRYSFPDRRFLYIPDNKQLAGQSRDYVDRELGILAFGRKAPAKGYKAVITNYTAHPLCVGNSSSLISADYQGALRRRVEETFDGCFCLATTGAAGDNHPLLPESGFAAAEQMGTKLAHQAIMRSYDAVAADDEQLRLAYPKVALAFKDDPTRAMLPERIARETRRLVNRKPHRTHVSLLGIGPVLLAGFPGEPVAELGAMLKWSSPFLKTYVLFMATDFAGYFPTWNQFYWGGYEPNTSLFARGTGEQMVERILTTARQLVEKQPLKLSALEGKVVGHPR